MITTNIGGASTSSAQIEYQRMLSMVESFQSENLGKVYAHFIKIL